MTTAMAEQSWLTHSPKPRDTLPPAPSNLEGELLNLEGELVLHPVCVLSPLQGLDGQAVICTGVALSLHPGLCSAETVS